jgi:2-keto-4-pentenoate hydratase/2-oxohepta-3-ene-1,7-dioic acid hydratase in catechol pathway
MVRIASVEGRAKLIVEDGSAAVDVAGASAGAFGPDPASLYDGWDEFRAWAGDALGEDGAAPFDSEPFDPARAGPPSPAPKQVFAVALNYVDHAAESGLRTPDDPLVFAKYVSAFSGPVTEVVLPEGHVDWECELVAVISRRAHRIDASDGWSHVAGLTVGQDISERVLQRSGPVPQFGLGKSHPGFAPSGPVLVTADEFDDPDDLALGCEVNGQTMQSARTADMIFPVPVLIAYLSRVVTLLPGDVIFTGTPPGVGMGRNPQVFLGPGDHLRSYVEGIGELHQRFVAGR